jgi:hypothetical protein
MAASNGVSSTAADESSYTAPHGNFAPVCGCCGNTMKHDHTIPRLGVCPELLVFVCPSCKEVAAVECNRVA